MQQRKKPLSKIRRFVLRAGFVLGLSAAVGLKAHQTNKTFERVERETTRLEQQRISRQQKNEQQKEQLHKELNGAWANYRTRVQTEREHEQNSKQQVIHSGFNIPFGASPEYIRKFVGENLIGLRKANKTKPLSHKQLESNKQHFGSIIDKWCLEFNMPSKLVKQVAQAESTWNPNAVSHVGAVGLLQVMPSNYAKTPRYVHNPFIPQENLRVGTLMLSDLNKKYHGDKEKVLLAYNAGSGRVDRAIAKYGKAWRKKDTVLSKLDYPERVLRQVL
jgi:hypothetical protein